MLHAITFEMLITYKERYTEPAEASWLQAKNQARFDLCSGGKFPSSLQVKSSEVVGVSMVL